MPLAAFGAAACAAIALTVVSPWQSAGPVSESAPGTRTKGAVAVQATVLRSGVVVHDSVPLDTLSLTPGDFLRVRVAGAHGRWLLLQGREDDRWVRYFAGRPPADGWLPLGLMTTPESETRLRVVHCGSEGAVTEFDRHGAAEDCTALSFDLTDPK